MATKSGYVVSANYKDRTNEEYPWLIRKRSEPLDAARACRRIEAESVNMGPGEDGESSFGCHTVAYAANAQGFGFADEEKSKTKLIDPKGPKKVHFDGDSFFYNKPLKNDPDNYERKYFDKCKKLELKEDGSSFAVL